MYKRIYTKNALKNLRDLPKNIAKRIVDKVQFFALQKNPLQFAKKLKNTELGEYRFRVGNYRVLFDLDQKNTIKILLILGIKHRKEAYDA